MKIMTDDLQCRHCNKKFKYESEKKRHELSHSPRFKCDVCNKKFSFNSALRRHEKQHQRTEKVQCKQCSRSFRDEALLKRHVKYAHKGQYTCSKCYAEFHSELALSTHEKTHNAKTERRYKCTYDGCEKTFNFPHHLKHHEMTHTNTKQHYCHICKKGFIQFHHFKAHMRTHELKTEKWLHCTELHCNKTFPTESSRKRHLLRVHDIKSSDISNVESEKIKTELKHDVEIDTALCTTCGTIVKLDVYEEHQSQCTMASNVRTEDLYNTKLEVQDSHITNDDTLHINDCKSALGGCIVDGDSSENCLCAQIKTTVDDYFDNTIIPNENINSTNIHSKLDQFEPCKPVTNKSDGCENCACSVNLQSDFDAAMGISNKICTSQRGMESRNCSSKNNVNTNLPEIEYKMDGSIKLKDTFDADIEVFENINIENKENKQAETYNSYYVPFNSCKAVLGRCIVSGNGTISEECLCAKMLVDEQQVTAEEIDEITPHPANTSYLSVI